MKIKELEYFYDDNDRITLSKDVKPISGIYVLFDKELNVLYVGESQNIRRRIVDHISRNNSNSAIPINKRVCYYFSVESNNKVEMLMVESIFINYLRPKFNHICKFCESDKREGTSE
jgi:excinuclease UvrABC nuclease subunit